MKIDEAKFIEELEADEYANKEFTTTLATLKKDPKKELKQLCDFIEAAINSDKIASAHLTVSDADTEVLLQTSIINLPLAYPKNINKIMAGDGEVPVSVNMIMTNPFINKSKLRIDELTDADEFVKNPVQNLTEFVKWVQAKLAEINDNQAAAETAEEATPKTATEKKKATRKTKSKK